MKNVLFAASIVLLIAVVSMSSWSAPFTPGNLVLADCTNDRLVEIQLGDTEAKVIQVVTWPLDDMKRRRPLGMAFDTVGNCYVGLTGVPSSATETVAYPTGKAEILRISPDGSQKFFSMPNTITKICWAKSYAPNEVYIMSNDFANNPPPTYTFRVRFEGDTMLDPTLFKVCPNSAGDGTSLVLADGRILIADDAENRINIYSDNGGDPIGYIATSKNYNSLAYLAGAEHIVALSNDQKIVDLLDYDGNIVDTWTFADDGIQQVFNVEFIPGDPDHFICCDKNPTADTLNKVYIYNANDFLEWPQIVSLTGLENFGVTTESYFDYGFVTESVAVPEWALY